MLANLFLIKSISLDRNINMWQHRQAMKCIYQELCRPQLSSSHLGCLSALNIPW